MNIDHHFEQQGAGAPIVFIHGSYATTSTWKKLVASLAATHHCITIKLPGHGGVPDPDDFDAPTLETELSLIERVVAEVTDQPIHLVGHSYGGVVALAQALKGSLALSQLTLFEPVAVWVLEAVEDRKMHHMVQRFLAGYRRDAAQGVPDACGQVLDFWGSAGAFASLPEAVKRSMAPLTRNNLRHWDICTTQELNLAQLQRLQVPTRIVCGSHSNPVAHAITAHLHDRLPNSKRYVIDGASHFMVTTHAGDCLAVLEDHWPTVKTGEESEDRVGWAYDGAPVQAL